MSRIDEDDLDGRAADYVLGLLSPSERDDVEDLMRRDARFAALVESWRTRLAPLDELAPRIAPSDATWTRIARATTGGTPPVPTPRKASPLAGLWSSLNLWRFATLASAAAALVLAADLGELSQRANRALTFVTVMVDTDRQPIAVVNTFVDGHTEFVPIQAIVVPEGKAIEVWAIADPARGPVSVGVIDRARTIELRRGASPLGPNQVFAITFEAPGGSPTGKPTGQIVAKGEVTRAL